MKLSAVFAKAAYRHEYEDLLRVHESRADRIYSDGFRRKLACEAARHLEHSCFGHVVVRYGVALRKRAMR